MSVIMNNNLSKLWIRIKSYINARLESLDVTVEGIVNNAIANAGHMEMELLWENASPTSEFVGQDITLDLEGYDKVAIRCRESTSSNATFEVSGKVGDAIRWTHVSNNRQTRLFWTSANKVTASKGNKAAYNAQLAEDNTVAIPIEIYGIKGVK